MVVNGADERATANGTWFPNTTLKLCPLAFTTAMVELFAPAVDNAIAGKDDMATAHGT